MLIGGERMTFKIIADSSCDLDENYLSATNIQFGIAPLTININGHEFVDDENINVEEMLSCASCSSGKETTSCPSCGNYLSQLNGADYYFIVTISSKLSGSYNSALTAKKLYAKPENVFVIDSKTTSGSMILIIDKIVEFINNEMEYSKICKSIVEYIDNNLGLYFVLNKFDNLIKNGRMSAVKAKFASALAIKPICEAKDGQIELSKKTIGFSGAMKTLVEEITNKVKNKIGKQCVISHCLNSKVAQKLKTLIKEKLPSIKIRMIPMKGLCSYYALEKGIIVGYEN